MPTATEAQKRESQVPRGTNLEFVVFAYMPRYYFDIRNEGDLTIDEEGLEFSAPQAVQEEAARSLADMARDEVRSDTTPSKNRHMAIGVRDGDGPLFEVKFTFEIDKK
jgi:hypothetical protein